MHIKSTLSMLCLAALAQAQSSQTASYSEDLGPDYGLTPSQTTAIIIAEESILSSLESNPTFLSIASAIATASVDPFSQLEADFAGDGSHLPTGTSARAAISSDIQALPTSGGVRDFVAGLESLIYSDLDIILGSGATATTGSGSATVTGAAVTGTSGSVSKGTSSSSSAVAAVTGNVGTSLGVKGALGGVVALGAVMVML